MMHHGVETTKRVAAGAGCLTRLWLLGFGSGAAAAAHYYYWWTAGWQPCARKTQELGGGGLE
jgi:hypothetical protein